MEEQTEEYYRQKYLKYKAKYLALQEQSGGLTTKTGIYYLFVDTTGKDLSTITKDIKLKLTKKIIKSFPSLKDMKKMFPDGVLLYKDKKNKEDKHNLYNLEYFNGKKLDVFNTLLAKICNNISGKNNILDSLKSYYLYGATENIDIFNYIAYILNESTDKKYNKVYKIKINRVDKNELLETFELTPINATDLAEMCQDVEEMTEEEDISLMSRTAGLIPRQRSNTQIQLRKQELGLN